MVRHDERVAGHRRRLWQAEKIEQRWRDIGLAAEEVEKVAPMFTFKNDKGQIEGVRYDRLGVVFVNAFKEQQQQIETQREQIKEQQSQIRQQQQELDALKKLVCRSHQRSRVCKR